MALPNILARPEHIRELITHFGGEEVTLGECLTAYLLAIQSVDGEDPLAGSRPVGCPKCARSGVHMLILDTGSAADEEVKVLCTMKSKELTNICSGYGYIPTEVRIIPIPGQPYEDVPEEGE
jgi:hypothetical protein